MENPREGSTATRQLAGAWVATRVIWRGSMATMVKKTGSHVDQPVLSEPCICDHCDYGDAKT